MLIDLDKSETLVRVSLLHRAHPDVLADFEIETLWDINARALEFGPAATTTEAEWCVVGQALLALLKAERTSQGNAIAQATGATSVSIHHRPHAWEMPA